MSQIQTHFVSSNAVQSGTGFDWRDVSGKSIIVTGGANGIGEATTRAFVAAGAYVTVGDVQEKPGRQLVDDLGHDKVQFIRCNVTKWTDQVELFKNAISGSPMGRIDVVIANAGVPSGNDGVLGGNTEGTDEPSEPDLRVIRTNVDGVLYSTTLASHYLPRQPSTDGSDRCLIVTASLAAYVDFGGTPQYSASKWAARGLMRCLRRTLPMQGIRMNILAPWIIRTAILGKEVSDFLAAKGCKFATVEDAADAVLHLSSNKSLHGRAFAVVSRELDSRGYLDLQVDDIDDEDSLLGRLQVNALNFS